MKNINIKTLSLEGLLVGETSIDSAVIAESNRRIAVIMKSFVLESKRKLVISGIKAKKITVR